MSDKQLAIFWVSMVFMMLGFGIWYLGGLQILMIVIYVFIFLICANIASHYMDKI